MVSKDIAHREESRDVRRSDLQPTELNPESASGALPVGGLVQQTRRAPETLTARSVVQLQRTIGNQSVNNLLPARSIQRSPVTGGRQTSAPTISKTTGSAEPHIQRFYLEKDTPPGYEWIPNKLWDPDLYEISKNNSKMGWYFYNLYSRKEAVKPTSLKETGTSKEKETFPKSEEETSKTTDIKIPVEKEKEKEKEKEEKKETAKEEGTVICKNDQFFVQDNKAPGQFKVDLDNSILHYKADDVVEYEVVRKKYITVAKIVKIIKSAALKDLQGDRRRAYEERAGKAQLMGIKSGIITLMGNPKTPTGAFKHYKDVGAIVSNDSDAKSLVVREWRRLEVTDIKDNMDVFRIDLGKPNSVIGNIVYTDKTKKAIAQVEVFHIGPSL